MSKFKKKIFDIIQIGNKEDTISTFFDYFIVAVIFINLAVTLLETFSELDAYQKLFDQVEFITILIFTVEYVLRLWTSDYLYPKKSRAGALFAFIFSFYGLIDLLTFFPYYLPFFFPAGVVAFRMFRVIRIFRLFKINAQYDAFNVIVGVIREKKNQLISSSVLILIFIVAASLTMYSIEHDAQPDAFKNAFSGMWWAVSALLTVGYGDIYPVTALGQVLAIIIAFLGVGMVAIPTGIISAGFVEHYTKVRTYSGNAHELKFIISEITPDHPWKNKRVSDIILPPGSTLYMILRHGEPVSPSSDDKLFEDDKLIIGENDIKDSGKIALRKLNITSESTWIGKRIRDIELPKDSMILGIKRNNNTIVPNASTSIKENDGIIVFTYED